MELVKLKMKKSYKAFLILLSILIILLLVVGVLYLFYDKIDKGGLPIEADGDISINYIDGKNYDIKDEEIIQFSVTNGGEKTLEYNINFIKVRGNGTYKVISDGSTVMEGNLKSIDEINTDYMSIEGGETKVYSLVVKNTGSTNLTGSIDIRSKVKTTTFADIILKNNEVKENPQTKVGVDVATTNEGLIKSSDDIGVSYYFRGSVNNNYVSFGDLLWRIVRINGDGTVRLVLDADTGNVSNYYNEGTTDFTFDNVAMKEYLSTWVNDKLKDNTKYLANTKFCSDVSHDDALNYSAYTRIFTNKIPSLNCLGKEVNSSVGLLTIDEVILAGANPSSINQSYYLYNSKISNNWYTMTGAKGNGNNIYMFMVSNAGKISTDTLGNLYRGVRPVINLVKNIEMDGTGTLDDPYQIGE